MWLWLLASQALADPMCSPDTVTELNEAIQNLNTAYLEVDDVRFERAKVLLEAAISCVDEVPSQVTVAHLHEAMSLVSFVNGQTRASRRALTAARLLDPTWRPNMPEGHPYTNLWEAATDAGPVQTIGRVASKEWIIDAIQREEAPTERAFFLQIRSEEGITQSLYLYDFNDIPDLGQNKRIDPKVTPWNLSLGLGAGARVLTNSQSPAGGPWDEQAATLPGGTAQLTARFTPSAVVGADAVLSFNSNDNPITGSAHEVEGRAVMLLGGATMAGSNRLYSAGRLGLAIDTVRSWGRAADGLVLPQRWRVPSAVLGAEVGLNRGRTDLRLSIDGMLAKAMVPWQLRSQLGADLGLSDSLALQLSLGTTSSAMTMESNDEAVGKTRAFEGRSTVGLAWRL